jgi:hypothetical protein
MEPVADMTARSSDPGAVALGVRTHSAHGDEAGGWAAYIVLGGPLSDPRLLVRGRMQLCDSAVEGSNQPFHRAASTFPFHRSEPMDLDAGGAFIERCRSSSLDLAGRALDEIIATHGALNGCCVLTGPARDLPPLGAIVAKHALQHAAEREFFREAVREAALRRGIATRMVIEKDLPKLAEQLPGSETSRRATLSAHGKLVGSPWGQDEKFAATAAWLGLAQRPSH